MTYTAPPSGPTIVQVDADGHRWMWDRCGRCFAAAGQPCTTRAHRRPTRRIHNGRATMAPPTVA
jgi:hypothetical protein